MPRYAGGGVGGSRRATDLNKVRSTMHVFAYGTLVFPEIWQRVVGRAFACREARITGFTAFKVRDGLFPVLVESSAAAVTHGVAYLGLDAPAIAVLDGYESEIYDRRPVAATLADGSNLECQTYVLAAAWRHMASEAPWDADWFRREAMSDYCRELGW